MLQKKAHVKNIGEWVNFTIIPPLVGFVGDILQQCGEDLNVVRPTLGIIGYTTEIARTILYTSLVQEPIDQSHGAGPVAFLDLFCYVHIAESWGLGSPRLLSERSVTAGESYRGRETRTAPARIL